MQWFIKFPTQNKLRFKPDSLQPLHSSPEELDTNTTRLVAH